MDNMTRHHQSKTNKHNYQSYRHTVTRESGNRAMTRHHQSKTKEPIHKLGNRPSQASAKEHWIAHFLLQSRQLRNCSSSCSSHTAMARRCLWFVIEFHKRSYLGGSQVCIAYWGNCMQGIKLLQTDLQFTNPLLGIWYDDKFKQFRDI